MARVAIIGAGSFGTALAIHTGRAGHPTMLWARKPALAETINAERVNREYLSEPLPEGVRATASLSDAVADAELVVLAVPSHVLRAVLADLPATDAVMVCAAKGIENDSLKLMPAVLADFHRGAAAFLSGPSFALELARGLPTAVVVASESPQVAERVQGWLSAGVLRCYTSRDVIGVEIGGALKNVYAIAAGACEGLGLGQNARAAMITRGLNEMALLGVKLGAHPLTFAGLAGVGDLVLTCTGDLSRNRRVGMEVARGATLTQVMNTRMVAEGVRTVKGAWALAQHHQVEMPILRAVYRVLYEGLDVKQAFAELSQRDLKPEWPEHLRYTRTDSEPAPAEKG